MTGSHRWSHVLVIVGLVAMVLGAIDPLEGSLIIVVGSALIALAAWLGNSRHRRLLFWAFALVAVGVGLMWWQSTLGGFGGSSGRTMWWAVILTPYPVGWILGLFGAVRELREGSERSLPSAAR